MAFGQVREFLTTLPYDGDLDVRQASAFHPQPDGSGAREVEDPAVDVRPAVSDADVQMLSVREIHHSDNTAQWHRSVSGGQGIHVEQFAVCGLPAVKLLAIPGSHAAVLDADVEFGISFWDP